MKIFKISEKTKDFYNWFNGSKVVDSNGNPMPVFHGTNQSFDTFDSSTLGNNTKSSSAKEGFFFTETLNEAKEYANMSASKNLPNEKDFEEKEEEYIKKLEDAQRKNDFELYEKINQEMEEHAFNAIYSEPSGQKIYSAYLNIKNPMIVDCKDENQINKVLSNLASVISFAKKNGHDGVKLIDIQDGYIEPTNQWVAFNPSQIRIEEEIWEDEWAK
jgi:hypothetical protein